MQSIDFNFKVNLSYGMKSAIVFISDLHLNSQDLATANHFFTFIATLPPSIKALYILGDLFHYWIGDDHRTQFNQQVKTALQKASLKFPIYLMPGNRDFLLGQKFALESGCNLLSDPYILELFGTKTILTHGDLLSTEDRKYQLFRKLIRKPGALSLFLKLPVKFRLWLAKNIQILTKPFKAHKNNPTLAISSKIVRENLTKANAIQMIHGHIHFTQTEAITINHQQHRRISLGDFETQKTALFYFSNHNFEVKAIKANGSQPHHSYVEPDYRKQN